MRGRCRAAGAPSPERGLDGAGETVLVNFKKPDLRPAQWVVVSSENTGGQTPWPRMFQVTVKSVTTSRIET